MTAGHYSADTANQTSASATGTTAKTQSAYGSVGMYAKAEAYAMADITRAELVEKMQAEVTALKRVPRHHINKIEAAHARINVLLTQLDMLAELEGMDG